MGPKPDGSRSRTGCLECRRRKRRCDETKPACQCCRRRQVECVYNDPHQVDASRFVVSVASDHHILPIGLDHVDSSFVHINSDEVGLVCSRYANPDAASAVELGIGRVDMRIAGWPSLGTVLLPSETEATLIQYYVDVICASRVYVPTERNVFLASVVPIVAGSKGPLLSTVLAMSAAEWNRRTRNDDINYSLAAAKYKTRALNGLRSDLGTPDNAEENLMTCVLQSSLEIADGSRPTWLQHFRGALAILDAFGSRISPSSAAAALQYFHFRLVLMRTTKSGRRHPCETGYSPPASLSDSRGADAPANVADDSHDSDMARLATWARTTVGSFEASLVDAQLGCSSQLLDIISAISHLSVDAASLNSAWPATHSSGLALEQEIKNATFSVQDDLDNYLLDSAECFRVAALVYLQIAVFGTPVYHDKMVELQRDLALHLSQVIFEGQSRRSFPMWPLFIAGCSCSNDQQRKAVLGLFRLLDSKWPISNISTVQRVVWTIWQTRDFEAPGTAMQQRDWQEIIEKFGWKLSLS